MRPCANTKHINRWLRAIAGLVLLSLLAACQPAWQIYVDDGSNNPQIVDASRWKEWQVFQDADSGDQALLLDRVFSQLGFEIIENVHFTSPDGKEQIYEWAPVAYRTWLMKDGRIKMDDQLLTTTKILVEPPLSYFMVEASILDIAPTAATALGIPLPAEASGASLLDQRFERVLLIYLDGFGYLRANEAMEQGLAPFLSSLEPPLMALATFPPRTQVSSASVLTGAPPSVHGVFGRNTRKTETQTILDVAAQQGLSVKAVEGDALSFALRNAEFQLSGDRNGDGKTDDEVLANTLAVIKAGQPDLFWVHFHGIDDAGHSYGPGSPEEEAMITYVDMAVSEIIAAIEPGTLTIIFADHGMHLEGSDGRKGNHGSLIESDMLIPIYLVFDNF